MIRAFAIILVVLLLTITGQVAIPAISQSNSPSGGEIEYQFYLQGSPIQVKDRSNNSYTLDPIDSFVNVTIEINDFENSNSVINITIGNNTIIEMTDNLMVENFQLGWSSDAYLFGFIVRNDWLYYEEKLNEIEQETGFPISLAGYGMSLSYEGKTVYIDVIDFYFANQDSETILIYDAYSGLLIKGISDNSFGVIEFELLSVKGGLEFFENRVLTMETFESRPTPLFNILIIMGFFGITLIPIIWFRKLKKSNLRKSTKLKTSIDSSTQEIEFINIPQLNYRVKVCCHQTARLNEKFCLCGRAVPSELRKYFKNL